MRDESLTGRQQKVLGHIRGHIRRWGVPPSRSELAARMGLSFASAVNCHLEALEKKGWIQINRGMDRGIRLLREGAPLVDFDDVSEVQAGDPTVIEERAGNTRLHDYDSIAASFESKPDLYLKVRGDSMDRVGFKTGDIVAVQCERMPVNGEVVVARIGDEVTLKRFWRREDAIELQPESNNPEHKPIRIGSDTEDFKVVGVVVGAIIGSRRTDDTRDGEVSGKRGRRSDARTV